MAITLKSARVNKGLTQVEASKIIGISVETLIKYEAGKTFPDVPIIKRIEEAYGVPYNDLIFLPSNNG